MANAAARDARKLAVVRTALQELIDSGQEGATGYELFGDDEYAGKWPADLMRQLRILGLVGQSRSGRGAAIKMFPTPALEDIVDDDVRLSAVIWPGAAPATFAQPEDGEEEPPEDEDLEEPPESEPPSVDPLELPDFEGMTTHQMLEAVVKLCAATLENVVQLRRDVADLRKAWE